MIFQDDDGVTGNIVDVDDGDDDILMRRTCRWVRSLDTTFIMFYEDDNNVTDDNVDVYDDGDDNLPVSQIFRNAID